MFKSLLGFGRRSSREVSDALYESIVASARQTFFYSDCDVPDTPLGRFEMLSVHMFLFLERARRGSAVLNELAQELIDEFFKDVEHSLRELGIGDVGVPKRMKKLAKMFYGRAEAYREALEAQDAPALAAALARNVCPERADWPHAGRVATYVEHAHAMLAAQAETDLLAGRIRFPEAGEAGS